MPSKMLAAAVAYSHVGLPVLPLMPRRKAPLIKKEDGGRGFRDATLNLGQIRDWWTKTPNANIGVRPPAGMIVVDVDPRADGHNTLANLVREHGRLPETWVSETGAGGWHFWFRLPPLDHDIPGKLAKGIDLKHHDSGLLVAAPSIHPNGRAYRWLVPPSPTGRPAPMPGWMRDMLKPPPLPQYVGKLVSGGVGQYTVQCLTARIRGSIAGSNRNTTLYGAAKDANRQGDLDAFADELAAAARAVGLPDAEINRTIESARRAAS